MKKIFDEKPSGRAYESANDQELRVDDVELQVANNSLPKESQESKLEQPSIAVNKDSSSRARNIFIKKPKINQSPEEKKQKGKG